MRQVPITDRSQPYRGVVEAPAFTTPILVPRFVLMAGGSSCDPVVVKILRGVVTKQRNAASSGPLGHIRLPVWGSNQQMLAGRNFARLVAIDRLVAIEL